MLDGGWVGGLSRLLDQVCAQPGSSMIAAVLRRYEGVYVWREGEEAIWLSFLGIGGKA